jgi:hypothetical protein
MTSPVAVAISPGPVLKWMVSVRQQPGMDGEELTSLGCSNTIQVKPGDGELAVTC